ncbi:MAG TPA: PIG-L family deacetylase [Jiangellaceae bacterium]
MTFSSRTVLLVHAHPDDESIFTGATIRRLADLGARVVLVTATYGELGGSRLRLGEDETLTGRRLAELESAAERLGVARLVLLGWRDSGLPDTADNVHPGALASADSHRLARSVAQLAIAESAEAILHDDAAGIYGHPDHIATYRIGHAAAAMVGVTSYEVTVDRAYLSRQSGHLVDAAAAATGRAYGMPAELITTTLTATEDELVAKQDAIAAHASQVDPEEVRHSRFASVYRHEWFGRNGEPTVVDEAAALARTVGPSVVSDSVSPRVH